VGNLIRIRLTRELEMAEETTSPVEAAVREPRQSRKKIFCGRESVCICMICYEMLLIAKQFDFKNHVRCQCCVGRVAGRCGNRGFIGKP